MDLGDLRVWCDLEVGVEGVPVAGPCVLEGHEHDRLLATRVAVIGCVDDLDECVFDGRTGLDWDAEAWCLLTCRANMMVSGIVRSLGD